MFFPLVLSVVFLSDCVRLQQPPPKTHSGLFVAWEAKLRANAKSLQSKKNISSAAGSTIH